MQTVQKIITTHSYSFFIEFTIELIILNVNILPFFLSFFLSWQRTLTVNSNFFETIKYLNLIFLSTFFLICNTSIHRHATWQGGLQTLASNSSDDRYSKITRNSAYIRALKTASRMNLKSGPRFTELWWIVQRREPILMEVYIEVLYLTSCS